jgi:SAM-dependent methyltransferase
MSESKLTFTGERLHADNALFGVDLLRHRAAYQEAIRIARSCGARDILEMGSGTGYGTQELASALPCVVVAVDRVAPLAAAREASEGRSARFLRADLEAMPLRSEAFDLVVSFQVIEHLADPGDYLDALAHHLRDEGTALVTTPNRTNSDGENPFHLHEYEASELERLLQTRFESVQILGVSARGEALRYHEQRLQRIRRIVRIDPFGLRKRIPQALVEWLFARLALVVRRGIASDGGMPEARIDDFPIEPANRKSLDLFAVCRGPRRRPDESLP